CRRSNFGVW
nr:immunoglobulin heavy chain junction region [Mus musculus]